MFVQPISGSNKDVAILEQINKEYAQSLASVSAAPVVVPTKTFTRMAEINSALVLGIREDVAEWHRGEGKLLPLDVCAERVLRLLKNAPYDLIGTLRPDLLHSATDNRLLLGLSSVGATLGLIDAIKQRFDFKTPVVILHNAEKAHDVDLLAQFFDLKVIHCRPTDLSVNILKPGFLFFGEVVVHQIILEVTQTELLNLSDSILDCIADLSARGRCLNDFRTIFIAHDKRLLSILCDAHHKLPQLDKVMAATLRQCIIPTVLASEYSQQFAFSESVVLKLCSLCKGVGIVMQHTCTSDFTFETYLKSAAISKPFDSHVVQPYVPQHLVAVLDSMAKLNDGLRLVSTLLSLDGVFYGPGVFRASPTEIAALCRGGLAIFPVMNLAAIPPTARSFSTSIDQVDPSVIRNAVAKHGVALVGLGAGLLTPPIHEQEKFESLVTNSLDGRPRDHNKSGNYLWEVSVQQKVNDQQEQKPNTLARSQTDEEFDVHTDCSFEEHPPRCIALAVIHADSCGGGFSSIANVQQALLKLNDNTKAVLRRTLVRWNIPQEFRKSTAETSILAPVLISDTRIRFRRDIITTDPLTSTESQKFWKALNRLEEELKCLLNEENNSFLLPANTILFLDNQTMVHARSNFVTETQIYQNTTI
ncbi:hypothetical protein HK100_003359 [Physocladia obscura]|uniref:TauD/TfdA-like domain-containing protein n=1 Tax=Physocladia obscura TaxID=109957 RepID=A0AAD5SU33_9FUNG|nr:hypothetical protein HK100_003359 [Physocladia obscura]